ncbi:MAG: glycosyltransferase family 2 protein [Flavobacteriales bacterium]|nr:glycosyltransferase family 2 protein [Flavobacteriales bacterium]
MIKVSIVIPCYNSADFIDRSLQSAFEQTYEDIEVICINDGSEDSTLEKLEQWRLKMPELTIIDQGNRGATAARNAGTKSASGHYIQYLDSDDSIGEEKIRTQVEKAIRSGEPDLVIGAYRSIREKKIEIRSQGKPSDSVWLKLMNADLGITSSNLFKRSTVLKAGSWDESLKSSQEYDLMFRILKLNESYIFSPEVDTNIYPRGSGSITSSNQGENWIRYTDLRISIRDHILENDIQVDKEQMNQILFDTFRMLYSYYPQKAMRCVEEYLPQEFKPSRSQVTGASYISLYKILGFNKTEKIKSLLRSV